VKYFEIFFLDDARDFIAALDPKEREKIIYNMERSQYEKNPKLFKKLDDELWEFRTRYNRKQYRLLAFWDKRGSSKSLVIATHGFIKKTQKLPANEINKAKDLKNDYFHRKR
jgi:phage-related protein